MHFLDLTLPTLAENLALDEALLLDAEASGQEALRLWHWPEPAVVLGAGCRLANEIDEAACRADGVPVGRRSSGGGTVMLGAGCLLFSLILRFERHPALADLHASYRFILGHIQSALAASVAGVAMRGTSDLAIGEHKFSGNAQQRKRTHLLHHGTLLFAFDATPIARYLKPPSRQPEYRKGRCHADFMTNLPATEDALRKLLRDAWEADTLADWPTALTAKLAREKYETVEWVRRR